MDVEIERLTRQSESEARKKVMTQLLAKNTIDEDMLKAIQNKEKVQDAMLEALRR